MEYVVESPNKVIFTEREVQVIREYTDGKSVADIAAGFGVSVRTVESYMAQIRTKLGVDSTVQVVAAFFRNKIIE